jgi:cytochrome c oxidase assembly protein subunit 15
MDADFLSNSVEKSPSITQNQATHNQEQLKVWFCRFVFGLAIATLFLMALGSSTRVMNAGLSCPDWPLCYGRLVPQQQMNLQVFLEWFHRLVASGIGFLTLCLCSLSWWKRHQLPGWVPWNSSLALGLVVVQGILGGLTVTELLRFDIVTAHLATGLLFFVTLLILATTLMSYSGMKTAGRLRWVGMSAAVLVYLQSILGALVASRWALHQCLGSSQLCAVMNSHIIGVLPASIATLAVVGMSWRTPALHPILKGLSRMAGVLLLLQVALGIATFRLHLQVEPLTVAHQAIGAALLGTLVVFTVIAIRDVAQGQFSAEIYTKADAELTSVALKAN